VIGPSVPHSEAAAKALAVEAACMANTDLGGALIVGVADDGTLIGTELDVEWLRRRIYDLTQQRLTVVVNQTTIGPVRLLVLRCPEAVEPVRMNNRITWRVGDACVEVDASTWHDRRMRRVGYDWSAQATGLRPDAVRVAAVERARDFLRASGEDRSIELADLPTADLLSRLNVVTAEGLLTNAGAIVFVGRPQDAALDYIRREVAGGDSTNRVRLVGRGLVEELYEVEQAVRAANPTRHLPDGLVIGQVRQLPDPAVREGVVNGCAHRDWAQPDPTVVEHVGATLVVTSPGGFVGGVTPQNIITHPSQTRNRALVELLAALRVAEREGVGVDRMVREMVRSGNPPPDIAETAGPRVRTALVGDVVDAGWMRWLARLRPSGRRVDLNTLLLLRQLVDRWWIDVRSMAPVIQRSEPECVSAITALGRAHLDSTPVLEPVVGVPPGAPDAWRLGDRARQALAEADAATGHRRQPVTRPQVALGWARARGRISSTELASVVGAQATNVGSVLKALERDGLLAPGRPGRRGPGFFYVPTGSPSLERP
jgi:ATP-dependent DNA helicase RecG